MATVVLICAGLLGFSPPDRSEYQAAAARAGRDAGAHLKLAVWCEAHGMDAERLKHLASALAIDPQNAAARGLLGLVGYGGTRSSPQALGETVKGDEALGREVGVEYEARAGRDVGAHLKLAVWCEAHGMDAERLKHLATALAVDPQNAAVRGMMGLVNYAGSWLPPEKVGEAVKTDEALAAKLAEYEAKRQAAPQTADAQWELGLWCEKNGLKAEATAHFSAVTQIAPKRAEAWRKLGCEFSYGRWISAEQADAERAEDQAQWEGRQALGADPHAVGRKTSQDDDPRAPNWPSPR